MTTHTNTETHTQMYKYLWYCCIVYMIPVRCVANDSLRVIWIQYCIAVVLCFFVESGVSSEIRSTRHTVFTNAQTLVRLYIVFQHFISIFRSKVIRLNILVESGWKFSELLPHACRKYTP